jgi:hypothetical protein
MDVCANDERESFWQDILCKFATITGPIDFRSSGIIEARGLALKEDYIGLEVYFV